MRRPVGNWRGLLNLEGQFEDHGFLIALMARDRSIPEGVPAARWAPVSMADRARPETHCGSRRDAWPFLPRLRIQPAPIPADGHAAPNEFDHAERPGTGQESINTRK